MKLRAKAKHHYKLTQYMLFGVLCLSVMPMVCVDGSTPIWWNQRGVLTGTAANDFAAVNQGQVKNIAKQAAAELDSRLPGGMGEEIQGLVTSVTYTFPSGSDYTLVNLGQLKATAKPFYNRLIALGYTDHYPWATGSLKSNDYAAASIGQVKNLFSFDMNSGWLERDSDHNGLPDAWEHQYFGHIGVDPNALTPGGSLLTNRQAYQAGLNPNVLSAVGDAIPDGWKLKYGLETRDPVLSTSDLDGDGLTVAEEFSLGTNPNLKDSDGDGVPDGEDLYPLVPNPSSPGMLTVNKANASAGSMNDDSAVVVKWNASERNPTAYRVERRENMNAWHVLEVGTANTSYSDIGLLANRMYQYRVTALVDGQIGHAESLPNTVGYSLPLDLCLVAQTAIAYGHKGVFYLNGGFTGPRFDFYGGFPEFGTPSTPPVYYLTRTSALTDTNSSYKEQLDRTETYNPDTHLHTNKSVHTISDSTHSESNEEEIDYQEASTTVPNIHEETHWTNSSSKSSGVTSIEHTYSHDQTFDTKQETYYWNGSQFDPSTSSTFAGLYTIDDKITSTTNSGGTNEFHQFTKLPHVVDDSTDHWNGIVYTTSTGQPDTSVITTNPDKVSFTEDVSFRGGQPANTTTSAQTQSIKSGTESFDASIKLTNIYTTSNFVKNCLDNISDWETKTYTDIYNLSDLNKICQKTNDAQDFFSVQKVKYKFTAKPSVSAIFEWCEVFIPNMQFAGIYSDFPDRTKAVITNSRSWSMGTNTESAEYTIDPMQDQPLQATGKPVPGHFEIIPNSLQITSYSVGIGDKNIAGDPKQPGAVVTVNSLDSDSDGIPDFADGYNLNGISGDDDDEPGSDQPSLLLNVSAQTFDSANAKIKFTYPASDPAQVVMVTNSDGTKTFTLPSTGQIRLWTKPLNQRRDPRSIDVGGDYIVSGKAYPLNLIDLYAITVEAVNVSTDAADIPVKVEVDPTGSMDYVWGDQIRITAVGSQLMTADAAGNIIPAATVEYSHPSPLISGSIACNGIQASADGSQITGNIQIDATVTSAVCDYTSGDKGVIQQIDVYVNDERIPRYSVPASDVQKGTAGTSLLKPFPFSAKYQDVRDVNLFPGTNVIRLVAQDSVYGISGYLEYSIEVIPTYVGTPLPQGTNDSNTVAAQTNAGEDEAPGPDSWHNYQFSHHDKLLQKSDGGEYHPYFQRFTGPTNFLQQIQDAALVSPLKIIQGPDQYFYARMHVDPKAAVLIALLPSVRNEFWDGIKDGLGYNVDFGRGFARGMWGGGASFVDGTWKLFKCGFTEVLRVTPPGILYVTTYGDNYRTEINLSVDAAKFSEVMAGLTYQLGQQAGQHVDDLLLAMITRNQDDIARVSAPYANALSYGAEVLNNLMQAMKDDPPEKKGYIAGRATFEIVTFLIPYSKLPKVAQLSKLEFLTNLKLVKYFKDFKDGEPRAVEALAGLKDLTDGLATTKMCFVAGTPVWTSTGPRAIETLRAGDWVLARDPWNGRQEYRRVERLIVTRPRRLYRVVYGDTPASGDKTCLARGALVGEADDGAAADSGPMAATGGVLLCTGEHPFYVEEQGGFVPAAALAVGTHLRLADGTPTPVQASTLWREAAADEATFTTYNLEVEGLHTYFVGEAGVWVHNEGAWCQDLFSVFEAIRQEQGGLWQSYDWLLQHPPAAFVENQGSRWALRLFNEVRRRHFLGEATAAEARWLKLVGQDLNSAYSSATLRANLQACLDFEGPEGFAAHHIVGNPRSGTDPRAVLASRCNALLKEKGVNINEASNGMWLPLEDNTYEGAYGPGHFGIHTAKYYETLLSKMQKAKTPDQLRHVLQECADLIMQGKFSYR